MRASAFRDLSDLIKRGGPIRSIIYTTYPILKGKMSNKVNPKLRPRLSRIRSDIVGNVYAYYPMTKVTANEEINEGDRVEVQSFPIGTNKRKLVDVKVTSLKKYGTYKDGKVYTVFIGDLVQILVGDK